MVPMKFHVYKMLDNHKNNNGTNGHNKNCNSISILDIQLKKGNKSVQKLPKYQGRKETGWKNGNKLDDGHANFFPVRWSFLKCFYELNAWKTKKEKSKDTQSS